MRDVEGSLDASDGTSCLDSRANRMERFPERRVGRGLERSVRWVLWMCFVGSVCFCLAGCEEDVSPPPINGPPAVSVSLRSTIIFVGQTTTLTWSSTNATACMATGAWSGSQALNGSQILSPAAPGSLTYTLTCTGPDGSATASAALTVIRHSLSITNNFSANAATISTSEGAPYGDADLWVPGGFDLQSAYGYGPTKVMRLYICLTGQLPYTSCSQGPPAKGPLSSQMLDGIDAGIAAWARSGVRLVIRFTYNFGPIGPRAADAPIDVISTHIDQLAPVLLKNRDLIFALEAGFIGTWGEWHDSTNGNDTPAAHKIVLDKELSYFNSVFPILVRYPGDLITYVGNTIPQSSLGIHDDYYLSSADDAGTWTFPGYTASQLMNYVAGVSTTSLFGGEFGALYPQLQSCGSLDAYSYQFHVQTISLNIFPPDVGAFLQSNGCATSFLDKVGTRVELQSATIIGNPTAGGTLDIALTLQNAGYGRVIRPRPATFVLVSNGSVIAQIPIALGDFDLRQLASSAAPVPRTFEFSVTLPQTLPSGPVSAAILVPDPASSLTFQPAYALPFNSVDQAGKPVFDPTTGFNTIASFATGSATTSSVLPLRWPVRRSASIELTATWSGRLSAPPRPSQMTWILTQSGTSVRGTVTVSLPGSTAVTGTITGTIVNGVLTYAVAIAPGGIPMAPSCSGSINGSASLTSSGLSGAAWPGAIPCVPPFSTGSFVLARQ